MRPAWMLLLVLAVALLPTTASAQVPDPAPVVDQACALLPGDVSGALPLCPRQEPDVPVTPAARHEHPAPQAPNPEDAQQLADSVKGQAEGIVEDPSSAPSRLASIVATVVQFVKDVLGLPQKAADLVTGAVGDAAAAIGDGVSAAKEAVAAQVKEASAVLSALWSAMPIHPDPVETPQTPKRSDVEQPVRSVLADALRTAGVPALT